jgi:hypothetical protein
MIGIANTPSLKRRKRGRHISSKNMSQSRRAVSIRRMKMSVQRVGRFRKEETSIENMRNNLRERKENKIIKKERRNSLKKHSLIIEKTKNILKHRNLTIKMRGTMKSRRR